MCTNHSYYNIRVFTKQILNNVINVISLNAMYVIPEGMEKTRRTRTFLSCLSYCYQLFISISVINLLCDITQLSYELQQRENNGHHSKMLIMKTRRRVSAAFIRRDEGLFYMRNAYLYRRQSRGILKSWSDYYDLDDVPLLTFCDRPGLLR